MRQHRISFFSAGHRLDGDLYVPEERRPWERLPAVIACSGYQGLKQIHPARFARALVPAGYAVLGFDYLGFGRSEGERGRLVPQEQVEDVRAAVSFLETREEVDAERMVTVEAAESLLRFSPEAVVDRIAPRPLLLVHGADNGLHSQDESRALYARAGDPKRLVLLEGRGHTEWMFDDHPTFLRVRDEIVGFLRGALRRSVAEVR